MIQGAVLVFGTCACAVVFASQGRVVVSAAFVLAAFVMWLGTGVNENE